MNRIQLKRTKGWRLPANTVSVARPGRWGNPFRIDGTTTRQQAVDKFRDMLLDLNAHQVSPQDRERFRYIREHINDLRGKNLACFCDLTGPCHADVLLYLANL